MSPGLTGGRAADVGGVTFSQPCICICIHICIGIDPIGARSSWIHRHLMQPRKCKASGRRATILIVRAKAVSQSYPMSSSCPQALVLTGAVLKGWA